MLKHANSITLNQLKYAGVKVLKIESAFALSETFLIKLKFTID